MENEHKIIGHLVEHPDISFQVVLTQKTDGSLEFAFIDHLSKTSLQATETDFSEENNLVSHCKKLIEKIKIAHRNVTLFNNKG